MSAARLRRPMAAILLLAALLAASGVAGARTRAWLDRDSAGVGEAVTLNIETDQVAAAPDFAPLQAQFGLSGQSSSRQLQLANGVRSVRSLFGVVLTPRQAGSLIVPALRVGNEATQPLRLTVSAASAAAAATPPGVAAQGNEIAFVETRVDDPKPYVQQSVGVVVRLYFATQLASGELDLDTPDGASLQRVGDDINSVATVAGRQYNVVERRFLLVPERSGALVVPGAHFEGRAVGGFFDDYFGRGNGELNARSAPTTLQVRAQPDSAPQPWLPLRDLRLRYTGTPQQASAGQAVQLTVEATASGATQAQFPELPTPAVADAQVFAEPPQYDERFVGGSPQLKLTRRYSIVPNRAGRLRVPGLRMGWWDVAAAQAREARLPDVELDVAPGSGGFAAPAPVPAPSAAPGAPTAVAAVAAPGPAARPWPWIGAAAAFALLWLLTLVALLRQRRRAVAVPALLPTPGTPARARYSLVELRKALDAGGMDEIATILCAMAGSVDLDAASARLADPAQRDAIARMQRARWAGDGDVGGARKAMRDAFWGGPHWRPQAPAATAVLEPLYPPTRR